MADITCIRYLPLKSFNTVGWLVIILFVSFGIVLIGISTSSSFDTSFQCLYGKTSSKVKDVALANFINKKCFKAYKEEFLFLPMKVALMLKFGFVLVFSIIYAYFVKDRVQQFDYPTVMNTSDDDTENQTMLSSQSTGQNPRDARKCFSCFSTFSIYIAHLFVCRIIPSLTFALCVFFAFHIPNDFQCPWSEMQGKGTPVSNDILNFPSNSTIIVCTNPTAAETKSLMHVVAAVDIFVVTLTIIELGYIAWLTLNDRNFMTDKEFCTVYLLRKRKRIRKLVNKLRERFDPDDQELFQVKDDFGDIDISSRKLEEIYVNVVIQEGKEGLNAYPTKFQRHEIYQSHLEIPGEVTKLTNPVDIFKPIQGKSNQSYPRTILVIGRPGIGKTMLTRKLMHQWKAKEDEFWHEKIVVLLQFRKLNNKIVSLREMLGYGDGLQSENFETMVNSILSNPTKTILIFDGLDELVIDSEAFSTNTESVGNLNARMPVFSIFRMLVYGRLLSGVTVLVTSRPTAHHLQYLLQNFDFQRTVEILGFFEAQIKEYVSKFCDNDNISEMIWSQITQSAELRSLCYIPVNSYIVCLTLKESNENIPKTITELYKRAIKVLLYRHHPEYKLQKQKPSDYLIIPFPKELEDDLKTLKELAYKGIDEGHLIFERSSCDEFGKLANSGFFHKLPGKERNFFCFLHLTLQEFFAALHVVDDMGNVEKFLITHIDEPKWHLVIQFVAGLVGDKSGEVKNDKSGANNPKESKMQKIIADIQKRFGEWACLLGSEDYDNNNAFLGIKCLSELQVIDVMKSVSAKFLAEGDGILKLSYFTITPLDSKAFFEFLGNSKNLKRLEFDSSTVHGIYSNYQMEKFFSQADNIASFSWHQHIFNENVKYIGNALNGQYCKLAELHLRDNKMTDEAVKYLSASLKNCELTKLSLASHHIGDKGVEHLSEALKSENCKLNELNVSNVFSKITDVGVEHLSEALKSETCKLNKLGLVVDEITEKGVERLSEALESEHCKLTCLVLGYSEGGQQWAAYIRNVLKDKNCKVNVKLQILLE